MFPAFLSQEEKRRSDKNSYFLFQLLLSLLLLSSLFAGQIHATMTTQSPSKYDDYLDSVVVVRSSVGEGTGFFVNSNGLLLTNSHVIGSDPSVQILLRDGRQLLASVVTTEKELDMALLSSPVAGNKYLRLADSNEGGIGSDVIAIGTALGLSWSLSRGIISEMRSGSDFEIGRGQQVILIQTDAAINQGNSGGPLILLESGRVVGINTMSVKKTMGEGISFAISAENIKRTYGGYISGTAILPEPMKRESVQATSGEPGFIFVPGGIYRFGEEEIFLKPFQISQQAFPVRNTERVMEEVPKSCQLPTMYQYLAAAQQPEFISSNFFERLDMPYDNRCSFSQEILDAEGVTGEIYFADLSSRITSVESFFQLRYGGTDSKSTISNYQFFAFIFWDVESRPPP